MNTMSKWALLAGRLALSVIFLYSGASKLASWSGAVAYAGSRGVPEVLLAGAAALELIGAISLLVGFKTRWGAAALLVYLVPVTLVFHRYWVFEGIERQMQMVQFLKNVGIAGGLLAVFGAGPGALSVDERRARVAA